MTQEERLTTTEAIEAIRFTLESLREMQKAMDRAEPAARHVSIAITELENAFFRLEEAREYPEGRG